MVRPSMVTPKHVTATVSSSRLNCRHEPNFSQKKTVGQNMLDNSKYALSSHFDWIVPSPLVPLGQSPHFLWMKLIAAQSQPIGIVELSSLDVRSPTSLSMPSKSPWTSCPIIKYPHRFKAGIVHKSVYPNLNQPDFSYSKRQGHARTT